MPADLLTEEICIDAVKQHADNLYWVPERLQTPKVCRTALENDYRVAVLNIRKSVLLEALNALEERYAKEHGLSRDEEHLSPCAVSCVDSNGLSHVIERFADSPLAAQVTFTDEEIVRSPLAAEATRLLAD